uniref:Uncharacterized protein n=1 Tax=Ditylenchus dipsaci TaxID=166011 RepID=A0A915D2U2_9BILA
MSHKRYGPIRHGFYGLAQFSRNLPGFSYYSAEKEIADETTLRPACIQSRHNQLREIKLIAYGWTKSTNTGNKTSPA